MLDVVVRSGEVGIAWLVLTGELDLADADRLEAELARLRDTVTVRRVMLDLRGLEFIDVTSLTPLVRADAQMSAEGRRVVIVRRPEGVVHRLLTAVALDRHLEWVLDPADVDRPAALAGPRHLRGEPTPAR